jgi:hypothetical protein
MRGGPLLGYDPRLETLKLRRAGNVSDSCFDFRVKCVALFVTKDRLRRWAMIGNSMRMGLNRWVTPADR